MVASENVEIVRGLYDAFRRRDNESPFEYFDRDIVWIIDELRLPDMDRVYHGHDGVRAFWRAWLEAWDELDWKLVELEELDDGRVRAVIRQRNKGRGAGIWVEQSPYSQIWTLAAGKVIRVEYRSV